MESTTYLKHEPALHILMPFHTYGRAHGLRVEASIVEGLRIDHLVLLDARTELEQGLVRRDRGGVVLQVEEAEAQQGEGCATLREALLKVCVGAFRISAMVTSWGVRLSGPSLGKDIHTTQTDLQSRLQDLDGADILPALDVAIDDAGVLPLLCAGGD